MKNRYNSNKLVNRVLSMESRVALRTSCKFDKQIGRCNNSQIKILNLFEFLHVLVA